MKKTISLFSAVTIIAILMMIVSVISCQKESSSNNSTSSKELKTSTDVNKNSQRHEDDNDRLKVDLIHIYTDVEDANMMPPKGENTLLYDHTGHAPVLTPDGHHVTLEEFNEVSGSAHIKCINTGTHVVVHLRGLIPKGVYTIWIMTLKSPGFNGTFANLNGVGSLGAPDGSQNVLTVKGDDHGTADLSVTTPAESLSIFGAVPSCWSGVYEVMLSGAYHLDGLTHGPTPGNFSTYVLQFGFPIFGSQLMMIN